MPLAPRLFVTTAAVALLSASSAFAQEKPAPKPAPGAADTKVAEVVVVGQKAAVTTSIDRKTYNVARDLQSTTGSVADVLRNLPSVDVDVDGNVSLRGQGVQILVDGKPSTMFSGAQLATTLQQLPANTLESIEVMTNPSAEFPPDGSGGIINLVTKKPIKITRSGSVQASVGSFGRVQATANGAYTKGKATYSGMLGVRVTPNSQSNESQTVRIDPIIGARTNTATTMLNKNEQRGLMSNLSLDYDVTPKDKVTLSAGYFPGESVTSGFYNTLRTDSNGVALEAVDADFTNDASFQSRQLSAIWRHNFAQPGRLLVVNARQSRTDVEFATSIDFDYSTAQPDRREVRANDNSFSNLSLSVNYTEPLANKALFKAGYDFQLEDSDVDLVATATNPVTGVVSPLPNITNRFVFTQTNHQVFSTYQRPFGKFSVLGGMRVELAAIDYDQRTTAITGSDDYLQIHPSLHVQYQLNEDQKFTVSYSHRVQRPNGSQLNPFVSYFDDFNASSGNPALKPQETHSIEAGWQWIAPRVTLSTTAYYRQNYNTIGSVSRFLTPLVVLNTFENQGTSTSSGMEFTATGKVFGKVSYNLGGNLFYNEIQRSTLAGGGTRSAFAYTTKSNIDYRFSDKDLLQVRLNYSSRQINAQGYRKPSGSVDLGYQRKIRPDLLATVTVNDLFETVRFSSVTDTPSLMSVSNSYTVGRTFSVGITKQFGGKPVRDGQFDYSTPTAPEAGGAPGGL